MGIEYQELINKAKVASEKSYSPYSEFPVGAALLVDVDGKEEKVYLGCNIENSSYSLCLCAERAAVAQAVSEGHQHFKAIGIIAQRLKPCNPCGACLQVLVEFSPTMDVILENEDGSLKVNKLIEYLPHMFTPELLQQSSPLLNKKKK